MKKEVCDAVNKQINAEFYSAYLYLSMAAYFESLSLKGFAQWMKTQAKEEEKHAMKLFDHVVDRDAKVMLDAIDKPKQEWKSTLAVLEEAYKHEQSITLRIHTLLDLARKEKDYAAEVLLHWFVAEQVEEEHSTLTILDQLKLLGDSRSGLLDLDRELGGRKD
ncbi:ferritin [Candidatus Woesearchaeota archaeon]|nr:ferritin [Candidatus Woesearchaeota archaeon]